MRTYMHVPSYAIFGTCVSTSPIEEVALVWRQLIADFFTREPALLQPSAAAFQYPLHVNWHTKYRNAIFKIKFKWACPLHYCTYIYACTRTKLYNPWDLGWFFTDWGECKIHKHAFFKTNFKRTYTCTCIATHSLLVQTCTLYVRIQDPPELCNPWDLTI